MVNFMAIWYSVGYLVYTYFPVLVCCTEKSLATLRGMAGEEPGIFWFSFIFSSLFAILGRKSRKLVIITLTPRCRESKCRLSELSTQLFFRRLFISHFFTFSFLLAHIFQLNTSFPIKISSFRPFSASLYQLIFHSNRVLTGSSSWIQTGLPDFFFFKFFEGKTSNCCRVRWYALFTYVYDFPDKGTKYSDRQLSNFFWISASE
jgi:hypothetical protein